MYMPCGALPVATPLVALLRYPMPAEMSTP